MISLLFVLAAISAIVIFYYHQRDYWKRRGVPGPRGPLFFGQYYTLNNTKKPQMLALSKWTKEFGKYYGVQDGIRKFLVVSDLDMLHEMFVKKFEYFYGRKNFALVGDLENDPRVHLFEARGARWKRLRTITAPTFSSNSLKKIHNTVASSASELTRFLADNADGEPFNIHSYYQEYTMDIISQIAMGQIGSNFFGNPAVKLVQEIFGLERVNHPLFLMGTIVPSLGYTARKLLFLLAKVIKSPVFNLLNQIETTVDSRIKQREEDLLRGIEPGEPADFIDLFLDARAESGEKLDDDHFSKTGQRISRRLTRDEIVGQCFVFLLAAFDTTANALGYTSWLLAKNPEVQKKLQKEIDDVIGSDEDVPYEKLGQLKYAEAVMKEAIRLFPPAAFAASRTCMAETTLGDVLIEKGVAVMADVWTIQRDPKIWGESAAEFVPERWESIEQRQQLAWMPFGAGPRLCIGQRLAYMEEKLALVHILRRFDIIESAITEKQLQLRGNSTVQPEAVTVCLRTRKY